VTESRDVADEISEYVRPGEVAVRQEGRSGGAPTWLLFIVVFVVGSIVVVAGVFAAVVLIGGVTGGSGNGNVSGDASTPLMVVPIPPARQGEVAVGTCIDTDEFEKANNDEDYTTASCVDPHDYEIYLLYEFPEGPYPGEDGLHDEMDERCDAAFWTYVGTGHEEDTETLGQGAWWPTETGWESGYRTGTCILGELEGGKLTGSAFWSTGKAFGYLDAK
jgi:hypothetical protein